MSKIPFIWSNDDVGVGRAAELRRQLDFIKTWNIPGTFFVVPVGKEQTIEGDADLLAAIREAEQSGHEFQQHGTRHDAFECGVPETWMLDFSPPTRRQFDEHRLAIERRHTFEAQVRMIDEGRRIWRAAFGRDPSGFRPGWGAFCGGMCRALDALGFQWVSSRIVSTTSWLWNQGQWDVESHFREAVPWKPTLYDGSSLLEVPMTGGDYAFHVPNEPDRIDAMVDLGMREFDFCLDNDLPFVMVSHYHGLARNEDAGYAVHETLLPRILETGHAEPMTISQLVRRRRR